MSRITISKVHPLDKQQYQKWCIDHAGGNLSDALRKFIGWIVDRQPTWDEMAAMMAQAPPKLRQETPNEPA